MTGTVKTQVLITQGIVTDWDSYSNILPQSQTGLKLRLR
jgi:hypothetical protein